MQSPIKIWRNQKKIRRFLGRIGRIVSFTKIFIPPSGFEGQAPYPIVLVDFGGEKLVGQLVDFENEDLKINTKVKAILRRIRQPDKEGVIPYGIKFKPI